MTQKPVDVDAYIAGLTPEAAAAAQRLRATVHAVAPGTVETIRYGMPAFQAGGATFLYLGAWKRHIGFYPIYQGSEAFEAEVAPFRSGKDTVRFLLKDPLPDALIARIVETQRARVVGCAS